MRKVIPFRCSDINSPYCPCLLAETNHCTFCSHLQGKALCDCNWAGLCVSYESFFKAAGGNKKPVDRMEIETNYRVVDKVSESIYIIEFRVGQKLADSLNTTGSFVFLRRSEDPGFSHFPVGIMAVEGEMITVTIEAVGPKTTRFFTGGHNIAVRGPYFNGIFGQPWIDTLSCGKILVIAGGLGQAPALAIIKTLVSRNNNLEVILAPGKAGKVFIGGRLSDLGVQFIPVESLRKNGFSIVRESLLRDSLDLIVSAGPDEQHYAIIDLMRDVGINLPMAVTNNTKMCCGEGICGSCERYTKQGKQIRTCKVQTDFSELSREYTE